MENASLLNASDKRWLPSFQETAERLGVEYQISIEPYEDNYNLTIRFELNGMKHTEVNFKQATEELEDWADGYHSRKIEAEAYRRDELEAFGDMASEFAEPEPEHPEF